MAFKSRYDYGDTNHIRNMEDKVALYESLMRAASRTNRFNEGKPTKEEADLYLQAADVCAEIMAMNLSHRDTHAQWEGYKKQCVKEFDRIDAVLNPRVQNRENNTQQTNAKPVAPNVKKPGAPIKLKDTGIIINPEHLCEEVTAEMVEKWFRLEKPKHGFDDLVGREDLKEQLMREAANIGWDKTDGALGIEAVQCYFLYGPPGSGKTYMIEAFAKEAMERDFHFMQLDGGDIHASLVGVAEKIVKAAFAVAIDNAPCLIFMDEIDGLCVSKSGENTQGHEKRLTTAYLEAYNKFIKSDKRLIFMGATNYPGAVDDAMLSRTTMIPIPLPDEVERVGYFGRFLTPPAKEDAGAEENPKVPLTTEEGFGPKEMAGLTDNYSYRDLDKLTRAVRIMLKAEGIKKYGVDENGKKLEQEIADEKVREAIASGEIKITREMFEKCQKENPITNPDNIRKQLEEFEKRVGIKRN